MPKETLRVGVVAGSHPPLNPWAERMLRPVALMADLPTLAPGTLMSDADGVRTVYLGDHGLTLHSGETGHYRDNLAAARPAVWVSLADDRVQMVTVDPYEGESLASDPARVVEAVAMPPAIVDRLTAFVAAHHVEEVFHKRRRTPAVAASDPRAPRILPPEQKWGRR
ncbi:MAG: DUF3305 domain-containing protein [Inquilinaceae bacterium]